MQGEEFLSSFPALEAQLASFLLPGGSVRLLHQIVTAGGGDDLNVLHAVEHGNLTQRGHVLGIIFVQAEFVGDLAVTQIQTHEIQARHPLPQGLMVPSEDGARQVIELPLAIQTAISLSESLGVVPALLNHMRRVAVRAAHPIGPTEFPDDLEAFFVVQELN
ncbi:hypothetical protein J2Y00_005034 [Deinococcus soli (ex Cha et al. 2016)]|uniref:Uncharacterized protein n=2 Tax=Deinococcus soli (ex Cha et al. 2016) TaxID=1309411 RepID=A0AAE3XKR7_9DEIO|nr:hypothetical protein [Deinococcus soli (ex Cha et al. 2016)]MDR6754547.1 hypothetical protein [Deinococcus soli (ex Cha et al. 2016)]